MFTTASELKRKRKAEDGTTEQVTQLKEPVYRLIESQDKHRATRDLQQEQLVFALKLKQKTLPDWQQQSRNRSKS